jgi:hypothetical protein
VTRRLKHARRCALLQQACGIYDPAIDTLTHSLVGGYRRRYRHTNKKRPTAVGCAIAIIVNREACDLVGDWCSIVDEGDYPT